jgi:predicted outer membrane protein
VFSKRNEAVGELVLGTLDAVRSTMRHLILSLAIFVGSGLAACSDDDNNNNNDDLETAAVDQGNTRGQALVDQARGEFQGQPQEDTMAMSADVVATIDAGEIAMANLVLSRTNNSDVQDLANEIISDHQTNLADLQAMMRNNGLAPETNVVSATLKAESDAALAQLRSDAAGDLELDYVQMQISMHQEAHIIVDNLSSYVQDSDMDNFLQDTLDTIDMHRDHAKDVLDNL